eukprot:TRINITY_DN607_c1_g2_i1.p2 TRINITY_DN607_c1_g2~~TRINITY_DN607_c1_g2_i1.p2  ORF type:complete len:170 (+),score=35.70 TRINITY_DN607_c1_g2_i1:512-1021(+)
MLSTVALRSLLGIASRRASVRWSNLVLFLVKLAWVIQADLLPLFYGAVAANAVVCMFLILIKMWKAIKASRMDMPYFTTYLVFIAGYFFWFVSSMLKILNTTGSLGERSIDLYVVNGLLYWIVYPVWTILFLFSPLRKFILMEMEDSLDSSYIDNGIFDERMDKEFEME